MRVAICVITRRRPEPLARLLRSLDALTIPRDCDVDVLLVENDDEREEPTPSCRLPLRRVFEPRVGIPFARNRALDEVVEACDRLAFVDDDETVEPDWLRELLRVEAAHGAAVTTGPQLPRLPEDAPAWAARSGVFEWHRFPTGTPRPWAFTGNLLARCELFRGLAFRFDESMTFTGGTDKELFRRVAEAGHRIVWADEAIVWEWYPPGRITFGWAWQRSYRLGSNAAIAEHAEGIGARLALIGRGARYAARACVRFVAKLPHPPAALAASGWDLARAAGLVAGVFGSSYEEYADRR